MLASAAAAAIARSSGTPPLLSRWLALSRSLSHARAAASSSSSRGSPPEQQHPTTDAAAEDTTTNTSTQTTTRTTRTTTTTNRRRADRAALDDPASSLLLPTVAVVGRPNVGKSALFNRLTGARDALVADTPAPGGHTTRDWREGLGKLADLRFRVVDTSGLEPSMAAMGTGASAASLSAAASPPLQARSATLTARVLERSHVALLVLDAAAGVTEADLDLGRWLRRQRALWRRREREGEGGAPVAGPLGPATIVVLNKAELRGARQRMPSTLVDLHANLGLLMPRAGGDEDEDEEAASDFNNDAADDDARIVALSARSGEGLADLYVALRPHVEAAAAELRAQQQQDDDDEATAAPPSSQLLWPPPLAPPPLPGTAETSSFLAARPDPSLLPDWPEPTDGPLRVAIMGLPNAGKSTLLNALLGRERALTGPEPGLTRDAPRAWLAWRGGLRVELTDTAGWVPRSDRAALAASDVGAKEEEGGGGKRKKGGGSSRDEARRLAEEALERGRRAMDGAHVVVLLLDAARLDRDGRLITKAELGLAAEAVRAGKALVVALNKADLLRRGSGRGGGGGKAAAASSSSSPASSSPCSPSSWPEASKMAAELAAALDARFAEAGKPAVVALSALEASADGGGDGDNDPHLRRAGAAAVLDACSVAYARWTRRASTSAVRRALERAAARLAGTPAGQAAARVKWAVQAKARPPTFALTLRGGEPLRGGGERFLASALREGLGLEGVPVRVSVRYNARETAERPRGDGRGEQEGRRGGRERGARAGGRGGGGGRGRR
jgi:predicted GTPase